jgi:hypothetical protein
VIARVPAGLAVLARIHLEDEMGEEELSVGKGTCLDLMPLASYPGNFKDIDMFGRTSVEKN